LTRASIEKKRFNSKGMDCRVKPGNDNGEVSAERASSTGASFFDRSLIQGPFWTPQ
jgi:hypothetical protein